MVPLSVPAPVQAIKHMGFGGPEDLRVLTEGKLTEGKQLTSIIPCVQKKEPQKEPSTERPLFPWRMAWKVSMGWEQSG